MNSPTERGVVVSGLVRRSATSEHEERWLGSGVISHHRHFLYTRSAKMGSQGSASRPVERDVGGVTFRSGISSRPGPRCSSGILTLECYYVHIPPVFSNLKRVKLNNTQYYCTSWSSLDRSNIHLIGVFATVWEYNSSKICSCVAEPATHSQTFFKFWNPTCFRPENPCRVNPVTHGDNLH